MKRICKFIQIPTSLYDTPELSILAKWTLLAIDSVCPNGGYVGIGVQGLSSLTNLPNKAVKEALSELHEHGAIDVKLSEDGQKVIKPLLYKDAYPKIGDKPIIGDKPSDVQTIDYQAIIDAWNEHCGNLQKVERLTPKRKQKTRTTLKGAGCTASDLIKAIRLVSTSSFLKGEKSDGWSASYDWLIKNPENLTKVLEGNYHKDYGERRAYETIMNGGEVNQKQNEEEDYYR